MLAEAAKTFLEFLKLAPRYLISLGVIAAILLFASQEFLKLIGVFELDGVAVSVVHTENEYEIRVISFRKASKRESQIYYDEIKN